MDESPQLYQVVVPVSLFSFLGFLLGIVLGWGDSNIQYFMVGTSVAGGLIGFALSNWLVKRREDFYWYQSGAHMLPETKPKTEAPAKTETMPAIILLEDKLKGITHRLSLWDMSFQQWIEIAKISVASNYAYNQNIFEQIFGREQEIGRTKYHLVSAKLETAGAVEKYNKGYRLTDWGEEKFEQLAKGDWRELQTIENNAVEI